MVGNIKPIPVLEECVSADLRSVLMHLTHDDDDVCVCACGVQVCVCVVFNIDLRSVILHST